MSKEDSKKTNTDEESNDNNVLGGTTKEVQYYGFIQTVTHNYWQTIIFIIIIIGLIFVIQYAQKRLNFPESKMIINWFGFIIIMNVLITYGTIMMYKQVKNQQGYSGAKGVQGPMGDQGRSEYCDQCTAPIKTVEQLYAEPKIKQPILPETIVAEPIGLEDDEAAEALDEDEFTFGGEEKAKTDQ
jgi:hypothetical protein